MQKKVIIIFLVLFVFLIAQSLTIANSEVMVEKKGNVTNYYAKQDPIRYAQAILQMKDEEKEKLYQYAKTHPEKIKPITYIALADYIFKTNKDDALFWYFVGRIRSTEDVMMCTDESNYQQIGYYPMLAEETMTYFSKKEKSESVQLMKKAIEWDEMHTKRVNPKWACYHGMQIFIMGDVTTKPMNEYKKIQKDLRESFKKTMQ